MTLVPLVSLTVLAFIALGGCSRSSNHDEDIGAIVAAEHAFADDIAEKGLRDGFLDNLGEKSVIFRPTPAAAVAVYESMGDAPGLLSWEPTLADVSASGDLGFTTGPWEFRTSADAEAVAFGQYVTVWIKNSDGVWKVAIDVGTPNNPPAGPPGELKRRGYERVRSPYEPAATFEGVLDAERDLWTKSSTLGFGPALSAMGAPDMVVLRFGAPPATGPDAALRLGHEARASWEPGGGSVSESGDIAYTYGVVVYKGDEGDRAVARASYLRIWEILPSGTWNVVLDLTNPLPLEQGGQ